MSFKRYPLDRATGLPALPADMFWRVSFGSSDHARLKLMQTINGQSYAMREGGIYGNMFDFLIHRGLLPANKVKPRAIRQKAREILRERDKSRRIQDRSGKAREEYAGDYPPRSL